MISQASFASVCDRSSGDACCTAAYSYLASPDSYELDPALPKSSGMFHTPPGKAMFGAFADGAPDRWGENLLRREERERGSREIGRMATAYETDQRRIARALRSG